MTGQQSPAIRIGDSSEERIDSLSEMLADLKRNGVEILKGPESDENGKFAWILDPDGNKVELWEPMAREEKNKTLA